MSTSESVVADLEILEFEISGERYCVDIDYVEEIVDTGELTEIPNSPRHVEGVMDLRGRTTTIINPKTVLNVTDRGESNRIIIFDPEQMDDESAVGWLVDSANQVRRIDEDSVEDPRATDDQAVNGIIKLDDEFVIYIDPKTINS